MNLYN